MITSVLLVFACGILLTTIAANVKLYTTIRTLHHRKRISVPSMLEELPSVSVCIPVRNEEHVMTRCLEDVLASRYPKMEVIVCDDSSNDKTPSIVKVFARDGVRFIEAPKLAEGWLGKNAALDKLLDEASGSYVLFLDVDTRIAPDTIGQLVAHAKQTKAHMVSALPIRVHSWRASTVLSPLRYLWKLLRHSPTHPIATSSLWLLERKAFIQQFKDMSFVRNATEPELEIARQFAASNSYRFLISYASLGVAYEKKLSSQLETEVRLRFPSYHSSVLYSIFAAFGLLAYLALPTSLLLAHTSVYAVVLAIGCIVAAYVLHWQYLAVVWQKGKYIGALLFPVIVLLDIVIIIQSMVSYLRKRVTWKGRVITQ